jgi:hypothetical protein
MAMSTVNPARKGQTKMLQVPVDQDLHKKFKLKCMVLGTTMAQQIERLMEDFLKGRAHGKRA